MEKERERGQYAFLFATPADLQAATSFVELFISRSLSALAGSGCGSWICCRGPLHSRVAITDCKRMDQAMNPTSLRHPKFSIFIY
jgi:hypothetical protein